MNSTRNYVQQNEYIIVIKSKVKPGRVLFEASGCTENVAREAMALAAEKLSLHCKFLTRESHK